MKVFYSFFAAATLLCGYLWLTDPAGSGMGYATATFATIGAVTALVQWIRTGSPLS
jgi:hypothetical protein